MFTHWKKKTTQPVQKQTNTNEDTIIHEMRQAAIQEFHTIPIPSNFTDPLLYELFVDPVMTSYGRIYSRRSIMRHIESIGTDPLTHEPLLRKQLYAVPEEITDILEKLKDLQSIMKKKLFEAKDSDAISRLMSGYRVRLVQLDGEMAEACKNEVTQASIRNIKNNLKIDPSNSEHRVFWQKKGKNGKEIPTHVNNMMVAANDSYDSVDDFLQAVNAERRSSSCGEFFKNCFRDVSTRNLYNQKDENLKNFIVR